jgi:glutathione S-transferase
LPLRGCSAVCATHKLTARRHGREPDATLATLAEKHTALLAKRLAVYDQILGKQNYLAGDSLTLADLFHLTHGGRVNSVRLLPLHRSC